MLMLAQTTPTLPNYNPFLHPLFIFLKRLPNGLTHAFKRIVIQIAETQASALGVDVQDILIGENHFHDLRHTHASILYAQGTPDVVISKRLGHATVAITMEIYVHIRPTMEKDYIKNYKVHPTKTWV